MAARGSWGPSLVVWWLRLCALNAGDRVQSLVGELDPALRAAIRDLAHGTEDSRMLQIRPSQIPK